MNALKISTFGVASVHNPNRNVNTTHPSPNGWPNRKSLILKDANRKILTVKPYP